MRDAADLRPILVNLRVDAPLGGNLHRAVAAGMLQNLSAHIENEDLIDPDPVLARAGARRHQHDVGVWNANGNVAVKPDQFLHAENAAHDRELAPQRDLFIGDLPLVAVCHRFLPRVS